MSLKKARRQNDGQRCLRHLPNIHSALRWTRRKATQGFDLIYPLWRQCVQGCFWVLYFWTDVPDRAVVICPEITSAGEQGNGLAFALSQAVPKIIER
jgi:hypothetical protein